MGHRTTREGGSLIRIARTGSVVALLLVLTAASAAADCADPVGRLASVQGKVDLQYGAGEAWQQARLDAPLCPGTRI